MSCNGCRVLRKGCSESCVLRSCLQWIPSPESQGHATLFLARFFGRSDLLSLVSAVPHHQRPSLFQSLLFEACGRTVNPVNGAVGLLSTGNWHVCQAAVETVLAGGDLRPADESSRRQIQSQPSNMSSRSGVGRGRSCARRREAAASEEFEMTSGGSVERKLLNLFV